MASRTYIPTLKVVTYAVIRFVTRYRVQIDRNLTEDQIALLTVLLDAAQALADALPASPVGP